MIILTNDIDTLYRATAHTLPLSCFSVLVRPLFGIR